MKLFTRKEIQATEQSALNALRVKDTLAAKALNEKTKKLDLINIEIERKLFEKEKAYSEANAAFKALIADNERTVTFLEERRKTALTPLIEEEKRLLAVKSDIEHQKVAIAEEKVALIKERERLSEIENNLRKKEIEIDYRQAAMLSAIERDKKDAEDMKDVAKSIYASAEHAQNIAIKRTKEMDEKIASNAKAEASARAAMALADMRIQELDVEKRKVDEKRRMLSHAIAELKKRGLWQTRLETKIK